MPLLPLASIYFRIEDFGTILESAVLFMAVLIRIEDFGYG